MRFDALQARASASEKLLGEAREHLLARADEIRTYDRRAGELALERDALQARVADLETERIQRESNSRRSIRPARPSSNAAPRSPALLPQRKRH